MKQINYAMLQAPPKPKKESRELRLFKSILSAIDSREVVANIFHEGWLSISALSEWLQKEFQGTDWEYRFVPRRLVKSMIKIGLVPQREGNVKPIKERGNVIKAIYIPRGRVKYQIELREREESV
jgi:hypothetical protein